MTPLPAPSSVRSPGHTALIDHIVTGDHFTAFREATRVDPEQIDPWA
jgi:hypothetical protein